MSSRLAAPMRSALVVVLFAPIGFATVASAGAAHDRVLALFEDATLVCLGERHLSKQDSDFRIELIRDPRFAERAGIVVIEFGNPLYQDVLDDYLLKLKDVPNQRLARVWRNTITRSGVWDSPIYEAFIRELRKANERLPRDKRIRVIGGDPPVDWDKVEVFEDLLPFRDRGWQAVRQVEREVLERNRKALVIYGYGHFLRRDSEMDEDDNLIRRLEALHPDLVVRIVVPFASLDGEPLNLDGVLDTRDRPAFVSANDAHINSWNAGEFLSGAAGRLPETVDALIYFGSPDEMVHPADDFYTQHPGYQLEMERRRGLTRRLSPRSYN